MSSFSASDLLSRIADIVCNSEEKERQKEKEERTPKAGTPPAPKPKGTKHRLLRPLSPVIHAALLEQQQTSAPPDLSLPPLSAAAHAAIEHVRASTAKKSGAGLTRHLAAVGLRFRQAPLIIHIKADILPLLLEDTHYRNQFETGTSSATLSPPSRNSWESRLFGNTYAAATPFEKVKYGCLNIWSAPGGVPGAAATYGDSYIILKEEMRQRCTFTVGDSGGGKEVALFDDNCGHVLSTLEPAALRALADGTSHTLTSYVEVQVHGPLPLNRCVAALVLHARHRADVGGAFTNGYRFAKKFGVDLRFTDG